MGDRVCLDVLCSRAADEILLGKVQFVVPTKFLNAIREWRKKDPSFAALQDEHRVRVALVEAFRQTLSEKDRLDDDLAFELVESDLAISLLREGADSDRVLRAVGRDEFSQLVSAAECRAQRIAKIAFQEIALPEWVLGKIGQIAAIAFCEGYGEGKKEGSS